MKAHLLFSLPPLTAEPNRSLTPPMPLSIASSILVSYIMVTSWAAVASFLVAAADMVESASIIDDSHLRLICIGGSIGGALVSWLLFASKEEQTLPRLIAGRIFASGLAGMMFSPKLAVTMQMAASSDDVLFVAGATGLCAYGVLRFIVPQVPKLVMSIITTLLGGNRNNP